MARSVKIHKKKSFMFTTKHHSFLGWMGMIIAVCTIGIVSTMIVFSYHNAGEVDINFGGVGLFATLLNLIGIISGILGVRERDAYITVPIISIVVNSIIVLAWIVTILIS